MYLVASATMSGGMQIATRAGLLFALGLGLSCRAGSGDGRASIPTTQVVAIAADADRFSHALHTGADPRIRGYKGRGLMCTDCHPGEAVLAGQTSRPGRNDHAPCDECHRAEFYKPPGAFCRNCHDTVDPRVKGATKLQPYPERGFQRVLAAKFSHRLHLDSEAMDAAVGFHVSCTDCHARNQDSREPVLPGHAQCSRCHVEQPRARQAAPMDNCTNCHPSRNVALARGRLFITGDLKFAHSGHENDKNGNPIACDTCHDDVASSRSADDVSVPAMQRCATCHEDATRTPDAVRIARCSVCHGNISAGSAPRNHLVGKAVPEDHTLEFRTNHGPQAADKNARCGFCHDGLSGSPRDSCFQCHKLMKPRDHNLGWREDSHGREAAADRDRCTSCHTADYCTACHSIPPRSHQPLIEFRLGGHAQPARFNLSSCFACHTSEDTCQDCHRRRR
jgi:hypothetical protein